MAEPSTDPSPRRWTHYDIDSNSNVLLVLENYEGSLLFEFYDNEERPSSFNNSKIFNEIQLVMMLVNSGVLTVASKYFKTVLKNDFKEGQIRSEIINGCAYK
ncbi:hypothetical protein FQN53_006301 [Emmonsiellopsis sp. PD_33]|nr:hypothetical protein FQN53_006301 [Emmonsiellopsis sp. PD_33]